MPPPPASAGQRSVLASHYTWLGDRPAAYLDETFHIAYDGAQRFYVMAAVVVVGEDRVPLRDTLDADVPGGYWHTSERLRSDGGRDDTLALLRRLAPEYNACVVVDQVAVADDDREGLDARGKVLGQLLTALHHPVNEVHESVSLAVIEEHRTGRVNSFDRSVWADLINAGHVTDQMRLTAVSPGSEHLLWLPDLVCSAYRQAKLGRGSDLYEEIEDVTTVMHLPPPAVDTPNG